MHTRVNFNFPVKISVFKKAICSLRGIQFLHLNFLRIFIFSLRRNKQEKEKAINKNVFRVCFKKNEILIGNIIFNGFVLSGGRMGGVRGGRDRMYFFIIY